MSELLAISAAICIALSGMLISELKGRVDVIRLARWQMLAAFAMTAAGAIVLGSWRGIGLHDFGLLPVCSVSSSPAQPTLLRSTSPVHASLRCCSPSPRLSLCFLAMCFWVRRSVCGRVSACCLS